MQGFFIRERGRPRAGEEGACREHTHCFVSICRVLVLGLVLFPPEVPLSLERPGSTEGVLQAPRLDTHTLGGQPHSLPASSPWQGTSDTPCFPHLLPTPPPRTVQSQAWDLS